MFKKAVFVILCLMAHHECVYIIQPRNALKSVSNTEIISHEIKSELLKCNISIPNDALDVCSLAIRPFRNSDYFNYDEALCITLNDFVERLSSLCNGKKLPKLQLERSDSAVKNVSVLCGNMRLVLNNTFSDAKDSKRKEWLIALKNKLNDDKMCKDACIHSDAINPVCLTLLQINSYLISNLSEKYHTSGDSEITSINKKQNVSDIQKAAIVLNLEDILARPEVLPKNTSLDVQQGMVQQDQVISGQKVDNQELLTTEKSHKDIIVKTKQTISTISNKDTVEKDNIQIPEKGIPVNKSVNRKHHINDTVVKEDISKQNSNTQETNNDRIVGKPSSDTVKMNVESNIKKVPPSNQDETIEGSTLNKLSLDTKENDKDSNANDNNKDLEKNKQSPIAGKTEEITEKPSFKLEDDNKEINLNESPANAEKNVDIPLPEPAVDIPKDKNSYDKTGKSPEGSQDSKSQSSGKSKTVIDSSTKKMSVPKTDVMEQTQAQRPDTDSEITEKDQTVFDGNTSNEEAGGKNLGENDEDLIGFEDASTLVSDDNDNNVEQNKNILPEMDEIMKNAPEKGLYTHTFVNAEDSHFFAYFMTMVIICIIGYLVYHNKQKILALALEGRSRKSTRRRPNTSGYRKLDSNLEEAVTSACSTSVTHVIY